MEHENEPRNEPASSETRPVSVARNLSGKVRWSRLSIKELRETLRDRRTIVTLILMPLLVYPILSLVFRTFLASNAVLFSGDGEPIVFQIVYAGAASEVEVNRMLVRIGMVVNRAEAKLRIAESDSAEVNRVKTGFDQPANPIGAISGGMNPGESYAPFQQNRWMFLKPDQEQSLEQVVQFGGADVGVWFSGTETSPEVSLVFRQDGISKAAAAYLQQKLDLFNAQMLENLLREAKLPTDPKLKIVDRPIASEDQTTASSGGFSLASLIPLVLVLMTITGAVYPAIDLTAGEKERGTLETLMAAPISRVSILTSKFSAVLTVAVLTAMLNMIGMATTIWVFQLDQFLTGANEFTLAVLFKIFLLLILFAAFFSALLLAVTSYARSFKEAQSYLIPIILLSLGPGLLAMTPGLELSGPWAVTPMVNILLLARDVIQNQVEIVPAAVAVLSTTLYAVAAIMLAARTFGSDAILYSTHGSFGEMFSRPRRATASVSLSAAIVCVVLLFPVNFLMIGFLGRLPAETSGDLSFRFVMMGVFTFLSFSLLPWIIAKHQRAGIATGFGFRNTRAIFYVAAILLGISLWPIVISLVDGWHEIYGWLAGAEARDTWRDRLVAESAEQVARVRKISPILIAMCLSIIPAFCEEWFFRGMLLRSLLASKKAWQAILISSIVFGMFHVLSNSVIAVDRLIPTTLVGIVLGYLAYKSDSILPGVILHAIHNAAVSFLAYYQPRLSEYSWFPGESDPVPGIWVVAAVVVATIGLLLVVTSRPVDKGGINEVENGQMAEVV